MSTRRWWMVPLLAPLVVALAGMDSWGRGAAAALSRAAAPPMRYAGWAMSAYPEMDQQAMDAAVRRQVAAGANLVWIGHNNPGEVGAGKHEPALSYAVYAAARNPADALHADALAMVAAETRLLIACRRAGVKAVLPVGYQIQMGKAWNAAHPNDVRRDAQRRPLNLFGGGVSASFYAPSYRRDIRAYYAWVEATFVTPYRTTIALLNLADEPSGGDYSAWANQAFMATHPYGLLEAGQNAAHQREVGAFESAYIAAFATWSAAQWQTIDPTISTTMSFDGGQSRYAYQAPAVEHLFSDPPATFAVTFDAYPRDGLFDTPLHDGDLIALDTFVRSLGAYSARYHRPLYLWSAANSWGLNEASSDPGTVADAVANGLSLALLATSTGGDLRGIAAWSYNVKGQGLYNDTHHTTYAPDTMFHAVSASFPTVRALMAGPLGRPTTLLVAPDRPADALIGARQAARGIDPYDWTALAALARNDVATAVAGTVKDADLAGITRIVVLPEQPALLSAADLAGLRRALAAGTTVIASPAVAATLSQAVPATAVSGARRLHVGAGTLVEASCGGTMSSCFADAAARTTPAVWESLLGRAVNHQGYVITGSGGALLYTLGTPGGMVSATVPAGQIWSGGAVMATNGAARMRLPNLPAGATMGVALAHREYAYYTATPSH